ncbi:MAG: GMC oxidoreductase, partial [Stellaceae bacterium]
CIIGAGAAGITLARELASTSAKIALFESGGLDYEQATQELNEGTVAGVPYTPLVMDRLRFFGGTTNHWSGGCRPLEASDFADWPFGRDTLLPYYRRAQPICQLGPFTYDAKDWATDAARPAPFAAGSSLRQGIIQYSPPTRFGQVYRDDLKTARNVAVHLHANLVDIDTDGEGVAAMRLQTLEGKSFRARAKRYVLAAGGIENARILLNAQGGRGVGNGGDMVGRCFMDHAEVPKAAQIVFTAPRPVLAFWDDHPVRGTNVQGFVAIDPALRQREGLPPLAFGFEAGAPVDDLGRESLRQIYESLRAGHIPDHLGFAVSQVLDAIEFKAEAAYDRVLHREPTVYSTFFSCGSPPDPASRVTLDDKRGALGLRRARLDWRLPKDFEAKMAAAHEVLGRELGAAGLGRLRINSAANGHDPMQGLGNGHHEMGTTRMHADPRHGVVDADGRVHGLGNFFIAGSSVFPSYGADNPTITIVALALRLADRLKMELSA